MRLIRLAIVTHWTAIAGIIAVQVGVDSQHVVWCFLLLQLYHTQRNAEAISSTIPKWLSQPSSRSWEIGMPAALYYCYPPLPPPAVSMSIWLQRSDKLCIVLHASSTPAVNGLLCQILELIRKPVVVFWFQFHIIEPEKWLLFNIPIYKHAVIRNF